MTHGRIMRPLPFAHTDHWQVQSTGNCSTLGAYGKPDGTQLTDAINGVGQSHREPTLSERGRLTRNDTFAASKELLLTANVFQRTASG